jgi:hypothetical protein
MGNFDQMVTGSWQDWTFVVGYVGLLVFVIGMALWKSGRSD